MLIRTILNSALILNMQRVIAYVATRHPYLEFALPELRVMLARSAVRYRMPGGGAGLPVLEFQAEVQKDYQREFGNAVMIKKLCRVLASGSTYEELLGNVNAEEIEGIVGQGYTYKCEFSSINKTTPKPLQLSKIHLVLQKANLKGRADLTCPTHTFSLIQSYSPQHSLQSIHFGLNLCSYKAYCKNRVKYRLSNRIYIGPTTTSQDLAFLMCHQANIQEGSLVMDPFVGTGGLLIPAAHYKARCFGSDIDARVVFGTKVGHLNLGSQYYRQEMEGTAEPRVMMNFDQYGLERPDIFHMDCLRSRMLREGLFDAIITDPPYGVRAMSRSASSHHVKSPDPTHQDFVKLERSGRNEIYTGLLKFANSYLRKQGRLVCLFPIFKNQMTDPNIPWQTLLPHHPNLHLLQSSLNPIAAGHWRVCLTFLKHQ